MSDPAETILQLGAGRFLRAFVDRIVHQSNEAGHAQGRVVVVQSTEGARADALNLQPEGFHVLVRGIVDGQTVERIDRVQSIQRALNAHGQWGQVLELARSSGLRIIVSNATEAGYTLSERDTVTSSPPETLPAKLTQILWARFQSNQEPVTLLPCELIERNADKLKNLVLQLCQRWKMSPDFETWVRERCIWLNNLVDCMVTNPPADHPLAASDRLLVHAEPYALWAIERPDVGQPELFEHSAIEWVDDLQPIYLRKVRILNGLHTAMVAKYLNSAFETVQQVLADRNAQRWVRGVLFEEIIPAIASRLDGVAEYADQTWDRLRNPFLAHRLKDIALHHTDKVRVRLQPTFDEYLALFQRPPSRLQEAISSSVTIART